MRKGTILAAAAASFAVASLALVPNVARACGVGTNFNLSAGSGPPGSQISATGNGFATGPVSLRWASPSGTTLAMTSGPLFTNVPLVIPTTASPGLYYVDAWDGVGSMYVTTTFTVTSPPTAPAPPAASSPPVTNNTTSNSAPAPSGPVNVTNSSTIPTTASVPSGVTSSGTGALHSIVPGSAAGSPLDASPAGDSPQTGSEGTPSSSAPAATSYGQSVSSLFEAPSAGFTRPGRAATPAESIADATQSPGVWPALLAAGVTASLLAAVAFTARQRRVRARKG